MSKKVEKTRAEKILARARGKKTGKNLQALFEYFTSEDLARILSLTRGIDVQALTSLSRAHRGEYFREEDFKEARDVLFVEGTLKE